MRRSKRPRFKSRSKFAIVVEGECEFWYLQMLKRNERSIGFDIEPRIPQKKTIDKQYALVKELAADYDKVFWIIDCDVVAEESRLKVKGKLTPLQLLEKYIAEIDETYKENKKGKKIIVIKNNPCLEYWLLLHFEETTALFQNCEQAGKRLKKHFAGYEKTQKFYTKQNNDVYLQLKPHLVKALGRAAKINANSSGVSATVSQMHWLFEELNIK